MYSKPDNRGVDECTIWGDYYYMEALFRLLYGGCDPPPPPPVLPQQDRRIAGQGVEKAQVVGVQIARVLHPVAEAVPLRTRADVERALLQLLEPVKDRFTEGNAGAEAVQVLPKTGR